MLLVPSPLCAGVRICTYSQSCGPAHGYLPACACHSCKVSSSVGMCHGHKMLYYHSQYSLIIINSSALISYSEQHVTCYVGFKARLQTLQYLVKPVRFYSVLNQSLNTQTQKHQMTVLHWVPSDVWPQYLDLSGLASAVSKLFIFHLSAPSSPSWSQVPS